MRAFRELAAVIVAGYAAFFGGIALAVGFVLLWLCGLASGLCLMVAMFAGAMFWFTGKAHDGQIALTYLVYSSVPFILTFIAGYYRSKFGHRSRNLIKGHSLAISLAVTDQADF
jgi:hypothetical protein